MEADVAVEIVAGIASTGKEKVGQIIDDDDASTIAKVRAHIDESIEKLSDVTHAKRALGNHLYAIKNDHKLSDMVISFFQKTFGYAIKQN